MYRIIKELAKRVCHPAQQQRRHHQRERCRLEALQERVIARFAMAVQETTSMGKYKTPVGWSAEQEETGNERIGKQRMDVY